MSKRMRQYVGIFSAIAVYYTVHEGVHLIAALYYGVFRQINFMGLGVQIDVYAERMTDPQLALFCLVGPLATLFTGWMLILLAGKICKTKSRVFKAAMWYVTLAMLLLNPLYLSILFGFFGGGDMNGIRLLLPESGVRTFFAAVGLAHCFLIRKHLLPEYTKAFEKE